MIGQGTTPFVWGAGGRAMTPEQVERERALVAAARSRMGDTSPVGHWTQGAARIVDAIGGVLRERRADKAETEGLESADAYIANNPVLSRLIGSGGSGITVGMPGNAIGGAPTPGEAVAADTMTALGMSPPSDPAAIREGLVARGLPDHIADAFMMNFQDESGLDPGINEIEPLVPGSRGGYGLYQLTGPRRRAYEAFAAERGLPLDSIDAQLDFMMHELGGPEAAAAEAIFSAPDTGSAAAAIVEKFLRPAEEHRARRVAEYTGGQGYSGGGGMGGNSGVVSALMGAMSDPWVAQKYGPAVQAILGQEMRRGDMAYQAELAQSDPAYQLGLRKAELELEAMRNPGASQTEYDARAAAAEQYGLKPGTPEFQQFVLGGEFPTGGQFSVITGEQAAAMGLDPAGAYNIGPDGKISQIGGGPNVTINNSPVAGAEPLGTKGQILVPDPSAPDGFRVVLAENSEAWREVQEAEQKREEAERQGDLKLGSSLASIDLNIEEIKNGGLPVTGPMGDFRRTGLGRMLTGSSAIDFDNRTRQITDSAAFAEIQNMRDNSPTGGAVGQLTDAERQAIGNAVTGMNSSTSAKEYVRAAEMYRTLALDHAFGVGRWKHLGNGTVELLGADGEVVGVIGRHSASRARTAAGGSPAPNYSNLSDDEIMRALQGGQ